MILSLLAALLAATSPADACGGPEVADLTAPLEPVDVRLGGWLYGSGWDDERAPVTSFLHAARPTDPDTYAALDAALAGGGAEPVDPHGRIGAATSSFHAALGRGDVDAAATAATGTVDAILDLPAPLAQAHGEALRLAVEFLEVRKLLRGVPTATTAAWFASTSAPESVLPASLAPLKGVRGAPPRVTVDPRHPRAASLRWVALQQAIADGVPNGWDVAEIRRDLPPGRIDDLLARVDAWLAAYPTHPLADLARLKKVRLHYLADDPARAWAVLLEQAPHHPARVVNEARFLARQGFVDRALPLATLPPELAAGLVTAVPVDAATWDALWRRSTAAPDAPWSLPLQERLLYLLYAERTETLPSAFPAVAAAPSPAWARLRLASLARAGREADAWAQLDLLATDDPLRPVVAAHLRLAHGDLVGAVRTPGLGSDAVRFLVRVLASDEEVAALVDDADPTIRWEARLSLASRRRVGADGWRQGVDLLAPIDAERAALWAEADDLSRRAERDPASLLALARFLRRSAGAILLTSEHDDVVWYRSLSGPPSDSGDDPWPDQVGPGPAATWTATEAFLERSFATWAAHEAYAAWLDRLDVDRLRGRRLAEARTVLKEADEAYNLLINYGSGSWYAWSAIAPESDAARTIRRVGKDLARRP